MAVEREQTAIPPVPAADPAFHGLLQALPLAINALDRQGNVIVWNAAAERLFGWTAAEVLGRPLPTVSAEDQEAHRRLVANAMAGASHVGLQVRRRRKDGVVLDLELWTTPVRDAAGQVVGSFAVFNDITARKQAEEDLRKSEERFQTVARATSDAVWDWNIEAHTIWRNENITLLFGHPAGEDDTRQDRWPELIHPDDRDRVVSSADRLLAGDESAWVAEYRYRRADGRYADVLDRGYVLRDADGRPVRMIGSMSDITDRKQTETAFRESYQLLRDVMEGTSDAIYVKDLDGRYTLINSAGAKLLGTTIDGVIGKDDTELFAPETAAEVMRKDRLVIETGATQTFEDAATAAGLTRVYLTTKTPYRDAQGEVVGVIGISREITERKRLEERLGQAQKMEAIGRLAGGVAHDFNNLLTAITGYCDLLCDALDPADPRRDFALEITRAADRATALVRQLLAYSRQQVLASQVIDLNASITGLGPMLRRLIGEHIELAIRLDPALRKVKADPGQLEQVILNLAVNSRDAMTEGGCLTIETANAELDETYAWNHVDVQPGAYVRLTVADTGAGMTEEVRSHLFEPFFTTKEIGKGTGLGLSTVYGIVKQSEGHIDVQSALGQGTTFRIYLPQVMEPARPAKTTMHMRPRARGNETVLLVEDEEAVRTLTRTVLQRTGYAVLEARHGPEAIHIADHHDGTIHLLLTDIVMPHMNGHQLFLHLTRSRPNVKVIYMSGYTEGALDHLNEEDARTVFLQKPFPPETLAQKVREVLDR